MGLSREPPFSLILSFKSARSYSLTSCAFCPQRSHRIQTTFPSLRDAEKASEEEGQETRSGGREGARSLERPR